MSCSRLIRIQKYDTDQPFTSLTHDLNRVICASLTQPISLPL